MYKTKEEMWDEWIQTRPKNVQEFAKKFPLRPNDRVGDKYFLGYSEFDGGRVGLIVTPIKPWGTTDQYNLAIEHREYICPDHVDGLKCA